MAAERATLPTADSSARTIAIQFCGFGGQGVILSSVIFGAAAVQGAGLHAVQTQSYGSESRGGECQAELILSSAPIDSPVAERVDILVALSQQGLARYLSRLRDGGTLTVDPFVVQPPRREDIRILQVPASELAQRIGQRVVANMVMLGFLQKLTGWISEDHLLEAVRSTVRPDFIEVDCAAARLGMSYAVDTLGAEVAH